MLQLLILQMTPHPQNWSKEVAPGLGNIVYRWLQDWETLFIGGASSRPQSHAPTITAKTELQKNGLDKTMFSLSIIWLALTELGANPDAQQQDDRMGRFVYTTWV